MKQAFKILGAILLLTSLTIGVYSLAIPFTTGSSGFFPAFLMTTVVWLATYGISLLYTEAILTMPDGTNFFSLVEHYGNKKLKWITGVPFLLFFFYILFVYFVSMLPLLHDFFYSVFDIDLSLRFLTPLLLLFALPILLGIVPTIFINALLTLALFVTLFFLTSESLPLIEPLGPSNWTISPYAIPSLFGAFGFVVLVPTLCSFLNRDKKALHLSLFLGLAIPWVIYVLLEWLVLSTFKEADFWVSYQEASPLPPSLAAIEKTAPFIRWIPSYYFLALFGSLLAYGYSLLDSLFDIYKIEPSKRRGAKRIYCFLLAFIPLLLLTLIKPVFSSDILDNFWAFTEIMFSFIPIIIVWISRYHLSLPLPHFFPGGKFSLFLLFIVTIFILWFQGIALMQ